MARYAYPIKDMESNIVVGVASSREKAAEILADHLDGLSVGEESHFSMKPVSRRDNPDAEEIHEERLKYMSDDLFTIDFYCFGLRGRKRRFDQSFRIRKMEMNEAVRG